MKRAKVHLTNGEVADIKLVTKSLRGWLNDIMGIGIISKDLYIPHHSIVYILFESVEVDLEEEEYEDVKLDHFEINEEEEGTR